MPNVFSKGFAVEVCDGGSFIVHKREVLGDRGFQCPKHSFTNLGDLMAWLGMQAANVHPKGPPLPDQIILNRQSFNAVAAEEQQ